MKKQQEQPHKKETTHNVKNLNAQIPSINLTCNKCGNNLQNTYKKTFLHAYMPMCHWKKKSTEFDILFLCFFIIPSEMYSKEIRRICFSDTMSRRKKRKVGGWMHHPAALWWCIHWGFSVHFVHRVVSICPSYIRSVISLEDHGLPLICRTPTNCQAQLSVISSTSQSSPLVSPVAVNISELWLQHSALVMCNQGVAWNYKARCCFDHFNVIFFNKD